MKKIRRFLLKQIPEGQLLDTVWTYVLANVCTSLFFGMFFLLIFAILDFESTEIAQGMSSGVEKPFNSKLNTFLLFVIVGPFFEEAIFRFPLHLIAKFIRSKNVVIVAALFSSIIFGYLHGNICNVFIQGSAGLYLSAIFLKAGGMKDRQFRGLWASFLVHAGSNGIFIYWTVFS